MSNMVKEFVHEFPLLDGYPRIYYFQRRLKDLLARFKRVTGALPNCFHDRDLLSFLERVKDDFEFGINVHVIGLHDIDENDLMFPASIPRKQPEKTEEPKIALIVCNISPDNFDGNQLEDITARLKVFVQENEKSGLNKYVFINWDEGAKYSDGEIAEFKKNILAALYDDPNETNSQSFMLIDSKKSKLRTKISNILEKDIENGFLQIYFYLKRFESATGDIGLQNKVFETDIVAPPVQNFLRNAHIKVEVTVQQGGESKEQICGVIFEHVINYLCRLIRCTLDPLAKKFGFKAWICNGLLHEIRFEDALAEAISKTTRHHLRRLAVFVYQIRSHGIKHMRKCFMFDFICYMLQDDMIPVIKKVEKKFIAMQRLSLVIRKMAFETHGYLKQTNTGSIEPIVPERAKLSDELRHTLLGIPGVYGLGTIYGQLEINACRDEQVNKDASVSFSGKVKMTKRETDTSKRSSGENRETELSTNSAESFKQTLYSKIACQLQNHNFDGQYTVNFIKRKPETLAANFVPGDRLLLRNRGEYLFGTLGGLIETKDGKLHGLTCSHVIGDNKKIYIHKDGPEPFSRHPRGVKDGIIDIAALEIIPLFQKDCKQSMERNAERITTAKLSDEHPESLDGTFVYKCGAATGETKGVIISEDYICKAFDAKDKKEVVMLDTVPDISGGLTDDFSPITTQNNIRSSQAITHDRNIREMENDRKETSIHIKTQNSVCSTQPTDNEGALQTTPGVSRSKKFDTSTPCEESSWMHVSGQGDGTKALNYENIKLLPTDDENGLADSTKVYIPNMQSILYDSDETHPPCVIFAKGGDSGSIVCTPDLTGDKLAHTAVSMLSAGDFEIEGNEGAKCLSFKLKVGLEKLKQKYDLDF